MSGPWTVHYAAGPPLSHPVLGLLPGAPAALVPESRSGPVLMVDDRNAGAHIQQGPHAVRVVTTAEALALLVEEALEADRALVVEIGEDEAAPQTTGAGPVTTWKSAARLLGVSTDTLARRRKESDLGRRCYFADEAELRTWWHQLLGPSTPPSAPRRRSGGRRRGRRAAEPTAGPVDFTALARELTEA